ncbi:MAG: aminoglycoside phosphotransferase family protein, partial [Pseudomonadota bacterium]
VRLVDIKTIEDIMGCSLDMTANEVPDWAQDIVPAAQQIGRRLLLDKSQWKPLHGDLHPRNIIADDGAWRVIDARAIQGPPAFEYANLFLNPWDRTALIFKPGRMEKIAKMASVQLGIDIREVLSCAIANALHHAHISFGHGQGRHPINCMRQLLKLLEP